jgi:hypothetical protein
MPRLNVLPDTDREVPDDEVIIIPSSDPTGEPEVFQPYSRVRLSDVLGDVSGRSEARREWRFLDAASGGPWAQAIRIGAPVAIPVVQSATLPGGRLLMLPLGLLSLNHIHGSSVNIGAATG